MKRVLLILGSIVVLIAAAATAFVVFFPKDLAIAELKKQVQLSTGRTLTIAGATSMTFWPALGISAGDVQLQARCIGRTMSALHSQLFHSPISDARQPEIPSRFAQNCEGPRRSLARSVPS